ncbi:hypothetical protein TNIN_78851 [Trichonephila inaurata madagascariensis]|uniref:Uncharacterized protein n=1 Tax=Trichonephila inaurata madagascariensis TaxID=2747483 RepID=A0A8X7CAZ1_9ARAC|nr:hypothetical protein TNIN_78851 [Trichonephila inaurata madagascariensis]
MVVVNMAANTVFQIQRSSQTVPIGNVVTRNNGCEIDPLAQRTKAQFDNHKEGNLVGQNSRCDEDVHP